MTASITRCAAIAVLAASCGSASQPGSVRRDSAGIAIIENAYASPAWEPGSEWRLSAEPQLQIGAVESTGPDQLYGVTDAGLLSDGTLYIVNARAQEARLFGPRGEHILSIGRRGQGPGEFRSPWQVYEVSSGDSLLIVDLYSAVSVFSRDGVYVRRFVPGNIGGERQGAPIGQFGDGTLLFSRYQPLDPSATGLRRSQIELVRVGLTGDLVKNFGLFDDQTTRGGTGPEYLFGPWAHTAAGPDYFVYGPGDRFELAVRNLEGDLIRLIRLDAPQRPVTQADIDAFAEAVIERAQREGDEAYYRRMFADAEAPPHFPAHFKILVDDRQNVWAQDYQPHTARVDRLWRVFGETGEYLGEVSVPAGLDVYEIRAGKLVGRWTDEHDVEYVRVYDVINYPS